MVIRTARRGSLSARGDRCGTRPRVAGVAAAALAALALAFAPGASAADCQPADQAYDASCGPEFELPAWGDAGGWSDPSHYSTIQLADVNGDGRDELIGRASDGLQIWEFDTKLGQWRPQVNAKGLPQALPDFRDPTPAETSGPNFDQPQFYSTIQAADVDGKPGDEIVVRFPNGMRVYRYNPPAGTNDVDGGTWSLLSFDGPFKDSQGYTRPQLYLSIHAVSAAHGQPAMLIAETTGEGNIAYEWNGSGWTEDTDAFAGAHSDQPADYLNLGFATLATGSYGPVTAMVSRDEHFGLAIEGPVVDAGGHRAPGTPPAPGTKWHGLGEGDNPFLTYFGPPDASRNCPAPGSTDKTDCFDSSPSYYETLRFANIDGVPGDEMLGRLSNGLNAYRLNGTTWDKLAVLDALKGSAKGSPPPDAETWGSLRTGDILGNGRDQVLALDGKGLQAWSYDPKAGSWSQVNPKTPLQLTGDVWKDPSHYSTIQVGDVNGDGHADVVARGPHGIRTWFYDRNSSGGWTSYLPTDAAGSYPSFSCAPSKGPCGTAKAFDALNKQARDHGVIPTADASVRNVWTGENPPSQGTLDQLQSGILSFANCSTLKPGEPPQYTSCTPPPADSGISPADWTTVVNEILAEIYDAGQVIDQFSQLNGIRQDVFLAEGAELPAIGSQLRLAGAAGNKTEVDGKEIFGGIVGIAGALAAEAGPVGIPLEITAELIAMMPSASETLTSKFESTYADLQSKFAGAVTDARKALTAQSQEVRNNYDLMTLVGELRRRGTWPATLNADGITSAADEGFALWAYKQLLPTMYSGYHITSCSGYHPVFGTGHDCSLSGSGPAVKGGGANFDMIGVSPVPTGKFSDATPCHQPSSSFWVCGYAAVPQDVATKVWGPLAPRCDYRPGRANTAWSFSCNLGYPLDASLSALGPVNGWTFSYYSGDPVLPPIRAPATATVGSAGHVRLRGSTVLPRKFHVDSATIAPADLLAPLRRSASPIAAGPPLQLKARGGNGVLRTGAHAAAVTPSPSARLTVRRTHRGTVALRLNVDSIDVGVPDACRALPPSIRASARDFALATALQLRDGKRSRMVTMPALWRCVRDRAGTVASLRRAKPPRRRLRPGLGVSLRAPRRARRGSVVRVRMRVRNRRRGRRGRAVSSLWHVSANAVVAATRHRGRARRAAVRRVVHRRTARLRARRTRSFRFHVRVPRRAGARVCVSALALAASARPPHARRCVRAVAARRRHAPRFTG